MPASSACLKKGRASSSSRAHCATDLGAVAHAAEADARNLESGRAKVDVFHAALPNMAGCANEGRSGSAGMRQFGSSSSSRGAKAYFWISPSAALARGPQACFQVPRCIPPCTGCAFSSLPASSPAHGPGSFWPTSAPTSSRWSGREAGDDTRSWGPPFVPAADGGNLSASYFHGCNRGKRSVAADLETEEGRALVERLAAHADVVIENFKVGGLKRYGLDYREPASGEPATRLLLDHRIRSGRPLCRRAPATTSSSRGWAGSWT